MSISLARSQLLRGDLSGRRLPVRPPWAPAEAEFLEACTRCRECVRACPESILSVVRGYPEVDFSRGGCTFCGACAEACADGALDRAAWRAGAPGWALTAVIGTPCLARQGVTCRSCGDACEREVIRFRLVAGGAALPAIDTGGCNGCGACVGVCPARAVSVRPAATVENCE